MTYILLRDWDGSVRLPYFQLFLKANPYFCRHFFITDSEINRDLSVYETQTQGRLTEREVVEFIKSVEMTNPHIQPMLKSTIKRETRQKLHILHP